MGRKESHDIKENLSAKGCNGNQKGARTLQLHCLKLKAVKCIFKCRRMVIIIFIFFCKCVEGTNRKKWRKKRILQKNKEGRKEQFRICLIIEK